MAGPMTVATCPTDGPTKDRPDPWHTDASLPLTRPWPCWATVPHGPAALPGSGRAAGIDGCPAETGKVLAPAAGAPTASAATASAAETGVRRKIIVFLSSGASCANHAGRGDHGRGLAPGPGDDDPSTLVGVRRRGRRDRRAAATGHSNRSPRPGGLEASVPIPEARTSACRARRHRRWAGPAAPRRRRV